MTLLCVLDLIGHGLMASDGVHLFPTENAGWVANKRFEISKFKFKIPRAQNFRTSGLVLGCIEAKFCK